MAKLVVRQGRNTNNEYPIPPESTRILLGRSSESQVQVLDGQASRKHAEIVREGSRFTLRDLKSANGTHLNGRLVEGEAELKYGDKIRIGETVYQFVPERDEMAAGGPEEKEAAEEEEKVFVAGEKLPPDFAHKQTAVVSREELEQRAREREGRSDRESGEAVEEAEAVEGKETPTKAQAETVEKKGKPEAKPEDEPGKEPEGKPTAKPEEEGIREKGKKEKGKEEKGKREKRKEEKARARRQTGAPVGWWGRLAPWAKVLIILTLAVAVVAFFGSAIVIGLYGR